MRRRREPGLHLAAQALPADADGNLSMCGRLGWTTVLGELQYDTDWLSFVVGPSGAVHGQIISTERLDLPFFFAGGCESPELLQVVEVGAVELVELVEFDVVTEPGQEVWMVPNTPIIEPLCAGVTPQEYDYELRLWGLEIPEAVGLEGRPKIESRSWGVVKARYR